MTPSGSTRRPTFHDEDLGEVVDFSCHSTRANGDLYEITQDLVEVVSHLQAMAKGHEVRSTTIVSALLQTSQDRGSGVPKRLQSLESPVAPFVRPVVEERERAASGLCSGSSTAFEKVSERWKHLAVHFLDGHWQSLSGTWPLRRARRFQPAAAASFDRSTAVSGICRPTLAVASGIVPTHDPSVTPLLCWSKRRCCHGRAFHVARSMLMA